MIGILLAAALTVSPAPPAVAGDTLRVRGLVDAPVLDGAIEPGEYGAPALSLQTGAGPVRVWLTHHGESLYLAAELPDSTYYWGDDLVVSLDPDGSGGLRPSLGDRQWYFRRMTDSSVVVVVAAETGRWTPPGEPVATLGAARGGDDWQVASLSATHGWTIELRVRETAVRTGSALPRLAIRTFNEAPLGWWSWPAPPPGTPAQRVESTPDAWIPVVLR